MSKKREIKKGKCDNGTDKVTNLIDIHGQVQEEIRFRQKRGDDAVYPAYAMVIAALGIQSLEKLLNIEMITILLAFVIPIIALTGVQRGHQEHKMVASARGYSSFLENKINILLQEKIALWNSAYIEKYIASMKVKTNKQLKISQLTAFIGSLLPVLLSTPIAIKTIYTLHISNVNTLWTNNIFLTILLIVLMIYILVMAILVWKECIEFSKNEFTRRNSALFPNELEELSFPYKF